MADKYATSDGWHQIDVTIQNGKVSADLTDFPVYLDLSQMPDAFWDNVADGGGDIRILKSDKTTEVPREVISCVTGTKTGEVWFKASGTLSSSADTTFVVCFGKEYQSDYADSDTYGGQNVWDSYYKFVSHMNDSPDTSSVKDSTDRGNDGTKQAAAEPAETSSGKIGNAQSFDGSDDHIALGDTDMAITGNITIEAWIKTPDSGSWPWVDMFSIIAARSTDVYTGWRFFIGTANTTPHFSFSFKSLTTTWINNYAASTATAAADTWYHMVGVRNGTSLQVYVNGSPDGSDTCASDSIDYDSSPDLYVGNQKGTIGAFNYWGGLLDELRISNTNRSAGWVSASYNNQADPSSFYLIDNYQAAVGPLVCIQSISGKIGENIGSLTLKLGTIPLDGCHTLLVGEGVGGGQDVLAGLGVSGSIAVFPNLGCFGFSVFGAGLGISLRQLLENILSAPVSSTQAVKNIFSGDPVKSILSLPMQIREKDSVLSYQHVLAALSDPSAAVYTISRNVYLDGRRITGLVEQVVIRRDQSAIHDDITITSHDPDLYYRANPAINSGSSRIEVHVENDVFYFLLETRSGSLEDGFSMWGRDITARESGEFADEIEYSFDDPMTAGAAAADMAAVSVVDWQADDWLLPADFDFSGYPIDGISRLAAEIGAIVRAQSDGSLTIRDKYPTRPVDLPTAAADVSYDQTELMALRKENVAQAIYEAVSVSSDLGVSSFIPAMEVEEDSPRIGDMIHIKVFWETGDSKTFSRYSTSGMVTSEGIVADLVEDEVVEFVNSEATTDYPVFALSKWEWVGASGGSISFTEGKKTLRIGTDGQQLFRVARVTYTTRYERLRLRGGNVSQLLAVLYLNALDSAGFLVNVITSDAADNPKYGAVINTSLLTTVFAAKVRGRAWLDDHHYNYIDVTFDAPYNSAAVDGAICYVNDDRVGDRGNYQIMASPIVISGPKVVNQITARRWV